jgi:hypothetical protein
MQVHDSLVWQSPTSQFESCVSSFRSIAHTISIPYPDPLIIPVGFKYSPISWGECK